MIPQSSPEALRCRVSFDEADGLRIVIPAPVDPVKHTGAGLAVGAYVVAGLLFLSAVATTPRVSGRLPQAYGLLAAIALGVVSGWAVSLIERVHGRWVSRRREVILVNAFRIILADQGRIFFALPPWEIPLARIRSLRYSPHPLDKTSDREGTSLAFDYKGETIRFGRSLSEIESRRLIRTIKDHYKIEDDREEALPVERL